MELYPAIDLLGGKVVRLTQGRYDSAEVYSEDPVAVATGFSAAGARYLHLVDLDGAREGTAVNYKTILGIAKATDLFLQVGGGIRSEAQIERYLELGVNRVILGTIAVEDFAFLTRMVLKYGDKIAVGVDARDGRISVKGWLEDTQLESLEFCKNLDDIGVATVIYTDISRDGVMQGANHAIYKTLAETMKFQLIASGGISSPDDIVQLRDLEIHGAILGRALYTGAVQLEEVLRLC